MTRLVPVPRRLRIAAPLLLLALVLLTLAAPLATAAGGGGAPADTSFPPRLEDYPSAEGRPLGEVLAERVRQEPLNLVATILFALAILHTFVAPKFIALAHRMEHGPAPRGEDEVEDEADDDGEGVHVEEPVARKTFRSEMLHFLGEIEAVFGIWAVPLAVAIVAMRGWPAFEGFIGHRVVFTEPIFVVVIMTIAATRPVLDLAERMIGQAAAAGRRSPFAWWIAILTLGPLLGSLITEPAAMVISALLLGKTVFDLDPSPRLRYGTLGLLFVNISIGGTLTHFAAPPVLMVAGKWGWGLAHMASDFGWKAVVAIVVSNGLYAAFFFREFRELAARAGAGHAGPSEPTPAWITGVHLGFLAWTVATAHTPALFVAGFLFFLAFLQATAPHQRTLQLRSPLLVGFFLAGLVVHGSLQQWWIAPVLGRLAELPLFWGAVVLTAFNDNAAITYLASLVPTLTDGMKHAVVAGAVVGGGLTVIANAPNPAGQAVLGRYFRDGISPGGLFLGALVPTLIAAAAFLVLGG